MTAVESGMPGQPSAGWITDTWDGGDHVHAHPAADLVEHTFDNDGACVCGPTVEPCERPDGTYGWLIVHHGADGRENTEPSKEIA